MPLTFGEVKTVLAEYSGRGGNCPTAKGVDMFVRQVLEYMLLSGAHGNLRKFCFNAVNGCFTVPYELDVPLKISIDGKVSTVWDKWFEFYTSRTLEGRTCVPASDALFEDPNYYPTVYDLPSGGAQVGTMGTCLEDEDRGLIVQGKDPSGREVITYHKGEQISGEYLSIKKQELHYTQTVFAEITGILKDPTTGYTQLWAVDSLTKTKRFLADYSPLEEKPSYRRFKLTTKCDPSVKVSVLGRIRLKSHYADTDFIPFDTMYTLRLAAQAQNSDYNDDIETSAYKDKKMVELINRENNYKRIQNGKPIEVWQNNSAGRIKNIVS